MAGTTVDREVLDVALASVQRLATPDQTGYVHLQDIPYRAHHLLAAEALAATEVGDVVFEGGVSSGYFAEVLTSNGRIVDGFEIDPVAAERARRVCRHVWTGDLTSFDTGQLDGPYDLILFGDTLEHLPDPVTVLTDLRRSLKPDGTLIISMPNIANWSIRLSLLFGRFEYADRGILDRTHLRFYTPNTVTDMLEPAGFSVRSIVAAVPVPGVRSSRLCRLTHRIGNLRKNIFAYNYIVTASASR